MQVGGTEIVMDHPLKFLWKYIKHRKVKIIITYCLGFVTSALILIRPRLLGSIVDRVAKPVWENITGHTPTDPQLITKLWQLVAGVVAITVIRGVLIYIYNYCKEKTSQDCLMSLREDMYDHLSGLDFEYFDKNRVGDIMTKMTADTDMVRHFSGATMFAIIENAVLFLGAIVVMVFTSPILTLVSLVVLPVVAIIAVRLSKTIRPRHLKIREKFSAMNTAAQENIGGNRVVKAFAQEDYEIEKFNAANDAHLQANIESVNIWARFLPPLDFTTSFMSVILLALGGVLVIHNQISVGDIIAFNGILASVSGPLRMTGWLINEYQRFSVSVQRISEFMSSESQIVNNENPVSVDRFKGDVEFENVSFKYGDESVLSDISFKANAGEVIAFVGPTGSGKSTIMNLICRFYDVSDGSVKIDGIDVKNIDIHTLRENISTAMQDIFLFSDTVEGNIAYGNPNASLAEVKRVAKVADAEEFIQGLSDGYDTVIGERGVGLSGGQKQRIALARALLKNPSILILDDTTSSVDMETEHTIHQTLKEFLVNKTTFIIAHRISSVKHADRIFVVSDGQIIESGTHDELINRPVEEAYYRNVFEHQMGDFDNFYKAGGDAHGKK